MSIKFGNLFYLLYLCAGIKPTSTHGQRYKWLLQALLARAHRILFR